MPSLKMDLACAIHDENPAGALKIYAELLRAKQRGDGIMNFVMRDEWFEFEMRFLAAGCLLKNKCPHQVLDILENVVPSRDRESMMTLHSLRYNLTLALRSEMRDEDAHKKLLEMNADVGGKNPSAFHEFGRYYARAGKMALAREQFENALLVLVDLEDNPINQRMKQILDRDLHRLNSIQQGMIPANVWPLTYTRSAEVQFNIGA